MRLPWQSLNRTCASRLIGSLLAAVCVLGGVSAPVASGGLIDPVVSPCAGQSFSQPFLRWLDLSQYMLVPNGGFESGSSGWALQGGAQAVAGNESFGVRSSNDGFSLALPAGASTTSSPFCLGTLYPTARLFVRNTGALTSTLRVEVLYKDVFGIPRSLQIATVSGTANWQPTLPLLLFANVTALPLLTDGATQAQLRFTTLRDGGDWRIDDIYVDPYMGR
jgi:hypothetical protein